jgi:hypothetical protein
MFGVVKMGEKETVWEEWVKLLEVLLIISKSPLSQALSSRPSKCYSQTINRVPRLVWHAMDKSHRIYYDISCLVVNMERLPAVLLG